MDIIMKKKTVYLCAALLALSLTSCGGKTDNEESSQETEQTESTGSLADSSSEEIGESEDGSQTDDMEGGDGGQDYEEGWSEEMEGLKAAVTESLGENYWPDMALLPDMLEMSFGITSDMYEDYMAEMPMISANVDTLLIVRAKDDKVEAVREALEAYRDTQINDTMQYPMNLGKVQASRIETIGNYVIFAQLGADTEKAAGEDDEAVIAYCQEVNGQVIDVIRGRLEGAAGN